MQNGEEEKACKRKLVKPQLRVDAKGTIVLSLDQAGNMILFIHFSPYDDLSSSHLISNAVVAGSINKSKYAGFD